MQKRKLKYLIDSIANKFYEASYPYKLIDHGDIFTKEYVLERGSFYDVHDLIVVNVSTKMQSSESFAVLIRLWDEYDNYKCYGYENDEFIYGTGNGRTLPITNPFEIDSYINLSNSVIKQINDRL